MDYANVRRAVSENTKKYIEKIQPNSMFMTEIVSIQQGVSDKEL